MRKIFNLFIFICAGMFMSACSTNKGTMINYKTLGELQTKDYVDHLAAAGKDYLNYEDVKTIKLRPTSIEFLEGIYERLLTNNQTILNITEKPTFYIIQNKSPFIFSLPRSQFFFSSALIERYLKSEELFVAAFAAEVLRSQRFIYEKNIMIPLGFYSTEKMIQLTRLKFDTKEQVNEWTYFILKRAGYDSSAYLNWIQVQNRNTLDFALFLGDPIGISKEEHLFKNFMSKQGILGVEKKLNEANSSKDFYKLLNNIVSGK
ncbi:MAG: hypothetical protein H7177_01495 [Rhizobacter sp.]|nr:hypothetical protein [Bacteriovorax sp.]